MTKKSNVVMFLWMITIGIFPIIASFDLIENGIMEWSSYLFLEVCGIAMIFSVVIWFFTYSCHFCDKLVTINDSYCKRCGTKLIKASSTLETIQTESSKELPNMSESPQEPQPIPFRRLRSKKVET